MQTFTPAAFTFEISPKKEPADIVGYRVDIKVVIREENFFSDTSGSVQTRGAF